jgi:hypothetical protein
LYDASASNDALVEVTDGATSDANAGSFKLVGNLADSSTGDPLTSVAICLLYEPMTCVRSNANGDFSIEGVAATRSGVAAARDGYVGGVWPLTPTKDISNWEIFLRPVARVAKLAGDLGATLDPSVGAIMFMARNRTGDSVTGVTVTSSSGKLGYLNSNSAVLDATLTATTADGGGYIFEIPPGDVSLTFSVGGKTCKRSGAEGWPATGAQTMMVPVQAGMLTRAASVCE